MYLSTPQNFNSMKSTKAEHAAKTQLYRWYQFYERDIYDKQRLDNQLEILAKDVVIKSMAGEMQGRHNYPTRLSAYKGWTNAHHVQNINVISLKDGNIHMEADILYQNKNEHGKRADYTIRYDTKLKQNDGLLPVFKSLHLQPTGSVEKETLDDAYPTNRVKSLLHYWLFNVEQLDGNPAPFAELLDKDFELYFITDDGKPLTTLKAVETWLESGPKMLKSTSHYLEDFEIETVNNNTYKVSARLKWLGIDINDNSLTGITDNRWIVTDDPSERFARIKEIKVEWLEEPGPLK